MHPLAALLGILTGAFVAGKAHEVLTAETPEAAPSKASKPKKKKLAKSVPKGENSSVQPNPENVDDEITNENDPDISTSRSDG